MFTAGETHLAVVRSADTPLLVIYDGADTGLPFWADAAGSTRGKGVHVRRAEDGSFTQVAASLQSSWSFVSHIPARAIGSATTSERLNVVLSVAVVTMLGIGLIYVFLRLTYDPIRHLRKSFGMGLGSALSVEDDLEAVSAGLRQLAQQKDEDLRRYVERNRDAVQDYLLLSLLNGDIIALQEFNRRSEQVGFHFSAGSFAVLLVAIEGDQDPGATTRNRVLSAIRDAVAREYEAAGKMLPDPNQIVFVIGSTDESESRLSATLELAKEYVLRTFSHRVTIAAGAFAVDIGQAGRSYVEARAAQDYRLLLGSATVILFGQIVRTAFDSLYYPEQEIELLRAAILRGDAERAQETVAQILSALSDHDVPIFAARCICFDIVNTYFRAMYETNADLSRFENRTSIIAGLTQLHSLEDLGRLTQVLSQRVCD